MKSFQKIILNWRSALNNGSLVIVTQRYSRDQTLRDCCNFEQRLKNVRGNRTFGTNLRIGCRQASLIALRDLISAIQCLGHSELQATDENGRVIGGE